MGAFSSQVAAGERRPLAVNSLPPQRSVARLGGFGFLPPFSPVLKWVRGSGAGG